MSFVFGVERESRLLLDSESEYTGSFVEKILDDECVVSL